MSYRAAALLLALALAGCESAPPKIAAPPPPRPVAPPPPPPTPAPEPTATSGTWRYSSDAAATSARFGRAGATADLELRCDRARRVIVISRLSAAAAPLTIVASDGARTWPGTLDGDRIAATIAAADPFLDHLAFSRGRFRIETPGLPPLIVPAWAEPARVIEDCRG